jgi:LAO/AO transport system kinase
VKQKDNIENKSALNVMEAVDKPPSINDTAVKKHLKNTAGALTVNDYYQGIINGDRTLLSRAITLVESSKLEHHKLAQELISLCLPHSGNSVRIGVTGVPGAGKSTFIEAFGKHVTSLGNKVAVLAIDPSSTRSKGSILGDKTRMEELSTDKNAFIRPSPSAGSLGGVARKTRETIILCEAAGYNYIFVETVGVGQNEITVHSMVDFFLLLLISGAGDELQGIKRGVMEMADAVLINKADGDNINRVNIAVAEIRNALHYFPPTFSGWQPQCMPCSAITKKGIPEAFEMINDYVEFTKKNKYFYQKRAEQAKQTMIDVINNNLFDHFYNIESVKNKIKEVETQLLKGELSPYIAAQQVLDIYFKK